MWQVTHCRMQMYNMPCSSSCHQQQNTTHWQTAQPSTGRPQLQYTPCIGTPVATPNAYTNQVSYPATPRDTQFDGSTSGHMLLPMQNRPQGPTFDSPHSHMPGKEYYTPGHIPSSTYDGHQPCNRSQCMTREAAEGEAAGGIIPTMAQGICGSQREPYPSRDTSGGHVESPTVRGAENGRRAPSTPCREVVRPTASAHTSSPGGALRERRRSLKEPSPMVNTNNSPTLLSTTSSLSSPPSTLSQRKQLRVEEKTYLKEVKRSIAEGRVPQVRLQQNNNGDIVQYRTKLFCER